MHNLCISIFLVLISTNLFAQSKYTISGYITDINNGESIVGVNIYCKALNVGVTSNTYGFYSLTIEKGDHEILFSFIGYKTISKSLNLQKNIKIHYPNKEGVFSC